MELQNPSQIFKSELRGALLQDHYNCFSTFNYNTYKEESRKPFGNLTTLNDETLAQQKNITYQVDEDQTVVIMPLVGALDVVYENHSAFVTINQIHIFTVKKGSSFTVFNPYENNAINFLQLRFQSKLMATKTIAFELAVQDKIVPITQNDFFTLNTCILNARSEATYVLKNSHNGIFAFVLSGAFEFQNRLIENRDGLKIWNTDSVAFEALSQNAMLLIIEVLI